MTHFIVTLLAATIGAVVGNVIANYPERNKQKIHAWKCRFSVWKCKTFHRKQWEDCSIYFRCKTCECAFLKEKPENVHLL
jgi:hypothetical protein